MNVNDNNTYKLFGDYDYPFKYYIYPHLKSGLKQRKEFDKIFCYNLRLVDYRNMNDPEYNKYINDLQKFIKKNNQRLISPDYVDISYTEAFKTHFRNKQGENSVFWNTSLISEEEKRELDFFLLKTGYRRQIDRFLYVSEGCLNDDKLFIGGKKEMILSYCRLFPFAKTCVQLKDKTNNLNIDKKFEIVANNPDTTDTVINNIMKFMNDEKNFE
jgi:hypothetical protein